MDQSASFSSVISHQPPLTKARMTSFRRFSIAERVDRQGVARVAELAQFFSVSEVTIRSDLAALEKDGLLRRDHGGAMALEQNSLVRSLARIDERTVLHHEEKQRIGQAAATLVEPGDTILLDAGTTVVEMCQHLIAVKSLTVVTNALNVALRMGTSSEAQLIVLGGVFNRESSSNLGSLAEHNLGELRVQKLFLGTQAMDLQHGLTDSTMEIAQVKRAMINAAQKVILLTDSSKWDHSAFSKVAPLTKIDLLISDTQFPVEAQAALTKLGVEVRLV